ncbi:hypothetical protein MMC10_001361 [Thelotrema lepadinum]|nr:hypothetical protein [Thelotrema lepadinum]
MSQLLDLPYEVLGEILREVEPSSLAPLLLCCKDLNRMINENALLFKNMYLDKWDDFPHKRKATSVQWQIDVKNLTKWEKILQSDNIDLKLDEMPFVADCIQQILSNGSPVDDETSRNLIQLRRFFDETTYPSNLKTYMCNSALFDRARGSTPILRSSSSRQRLSAKLHCIHGSTIKSTELASGEDVYPYAASVVYDLRNYTPETLWGPFLPDGSENVDWEMMEAILIVLSHNLRICRIYHNPLIEPLWSRPFGGMIPNSHIFVPPTENMPLAPSPSEPTTLPGPGPPMAPIPPATASSLYDGPNSPTSASASTSVSAPTLTKQPSTPLPDPYGITGTWMRVVCFLDYNELFAYNFTSAPLPPGEPRPALSTTEAIRMIVMHVSVTRIADPGPEDGQGMPVVHFSGTSRPRYAYWDPNARAHVRGEVRLTREGEVRWTTFSIYHGEERWRSEGVQIGGVRSARGIVGCWFDKDYDVHGPAGPTAFWKISEDPNGEQDPEDDDD